MPANWRLWLTTVLTSLVHHGMVGYQIGVLNNSKKVVQNFLNPLLTNDEKLQTLAWGGLIAIYHLGLGVGALFNTQISDKWGRKVSLMYVSNLTCIFGYVCCFLTVLFQAPIMLFMGRFFVGLGGGVGLAVLPIYLLESCPSNLRGLIGSCLELALTVGIFVSQLFGREDVLGSGTGWPFLVTFGIWFALLEILASKFFKESPKFLLITKKNVVSAKESVSFFTGVTDNGALDQIIVNMKSSDFLQQDEFAEDSQDPNESKSKETQILRFAALLGISQSVSGKTAMVAYSTGFMTTVGVSDAAAQMATVVMGGSEFVAGLFALFINHRFTRRAVLLITLACCLVANFGVFAFMQLKVIGWEDRPWFLVLFSISAIVILTAADIGPMSLLPILCSEIAPQSLRAKTCTIGVTSATLFRVMNDFFVWILFSYINQFVFLIYFVTGIAMWSYFYQSMTLRNANVSEKPLLYTVLKDEDTEPILGKQMDDVFD